MCFPDVGDTILFHPLCLTILYLYAKNKNRDTSVDTVIISSVSLSSESSQLFTVLFLMLLGQRQAGNLFPDLLCQRRT